MHALLRPGRILLTRVVEALLPCVCGHCRKLFTCSARARDAEPAAGQIANRFAALTASYLCPACALDFKPILPPLCSCCGEPFLSPSGIDHLCTQCERRSKPYRTARAVAVYDGPWRSLIRDYKYQGKVQLARPLGQLLWDTLVAHWDPAEIDGIIPVPLHPGRLRWRGFNQAALLTMSWREYLGAINDGRIWIDDSVLVRTRATPSQTGLDRQQRHDNLKAAFRVANPAKVIDLRLLLVDDVLTTGATIDACTTTLLNAGAAAVHVLTLGRVVQAERANLPAQS